MTQPISDEPARAPSWLPVGAGTVLYPPPSAAPPSPARSRPRRSVLSILPALAIVVVVMISFGVIAVAVSPRAGFDGYFPDDGASSTVTDARGRPRQLEQAVLRPVALAEVGPAGRAVSAGLDAERAAATRYLRATINPSPDGVEQVWFGAEVDDLQLSLVSTLTIAFALVPGVDVARRSGSPATTQTGTITAWDPTTQKSVTAPYRATVDATGTDCTTVTVGIDADDPALAEPALDVTATLCRGLGLTDLAVTQGREQWTVKAAPGQPPPDTTATTEPTPIPEVGWSSHARWKPTTLAPYAVDAFGPSGIVRGLQARPTVRDDDTLVVASATTSDLEAYTTTSDGLELAWRAHPGGSIAAITAVGDLTVVALADRRLMGYDADGLRVWVNDTITEGIAGELLALTDAVVLATLDGTVWRVDPRTGLVVWSRQTAATINKGVIGDDRVVQAIDTAGGVYGWVPSGQQVFNGQVAQAFDLIALDADNTYLIRGITMEAYELQRSGFLWGVPAVQRRVDLCTTSGGPVVAVPDQTVGLAPSTGAVAWSADGAQQIRCGTAAVVAVAGRTLTVLSAKGERSLQVQVPVPIRDQSVSGIATAPESIYVVLPQVVLRLGT